MRSKAAFIDTDFVTTRILVQKYEGARASLVRAR